MTTAIFQETIETLKAEIYKDPTIAQIVTGKILAACQGDKRAAAWLKGDGSLWIDATSEFLEEIKQPTS
jgi:hypothetical protein